MGCMPCIFLLGHVMSCQVRAYHDLPCNIRPCLDNWLLSYYQDEGWFLCHIILWRVITCYLMQCYVRPVHAILNHAMPYHVRLLISHTITRLVAEYYHLKGFMPCHIMPFCADMQKRQPSQPKVAEISLQLWIFPSWLQQNWCVQ